MPRRFPNELFDAIISRVPARTGWLGPTERETLLNCTLVCRDWLPASRHTLFSCVVLNSPAAWDSFLRCVVNAEEGRTSLASIHGLQVEDMWYTSYGGGKEIPAQPISEWRGQYIIPRLAGHLPNLEILWLTVNWERCQPHPATFGMFSWFTSLRELVLKTCRFPSFCTFRRILASLSALRTLYCGYIHWPSAPQPSILAIPSGRLALQSLEISAICRSCTLALLEWLIHTPTRSTLVELLLDEPASLPNSHAITLPHLTPNYYLQIFAPSLQSMRLDQNQSMDDIADNISDLSRFMNLKLLDFVVNGTDWPGIAGLLRSLPARLDTLIIDVRYDQSVVDSDMMVKEDGEIKAMRTDGLELLEPVLLRDNFKDLQLLKFWLRGYRDTLDPLRESIIQTIWKKLPKLHSRATLDIRLQCSCSIRPPSPSPAPDHAAQPPI